MRYMSLTVKKIKAPHMAKYHSPIAEFYDEYNKLLNKRINRAYMELIHEFRINNPLCDGNYYKAKAAVYATFKPKIDVEYEGVMLDPKIMVSVSLVPKVFDDIADAKLNF